MGGVANVPFTSLNVLNVPFTTSALSRTCRSQHPAGHCLARFTGETHDRRKAHRWIQVQRPEGALQDSTNSQNERPLRTFLDRHYSSAETPDRRYSPNFKVTKNFQV